MAINDRGQVTNGEIYIEFSWVALWIWGDRSAANPCHGFLADTPEAECLRAFVAYPDPHWPNYRAVAARPIEVTDTVAIMLAADDPAELERIKERIREIAATA